MKPCVTQLRSFAPRGLSRRRFIGGALAATATGAWWPTLAAEGSRSFVAAGPGFAFDTGKLRGTLRNRGQSRGLTPVFDAASGMPLAQPNGWFSLYRLLDHTNRYGTAAWDWTSKAELLGNGAVDVKWSADDAHPFDLMAVYRWSAPTTLDLTIRVTARRELRKLEVFLASYFEGFPTTVVYTGAPHGFVGAPQEAGAWQMFPRDAAAVTIIQDGRWQHLPHPVDWTIRPRFAAPLAVRRDAARGLAAVLMTRPEQCFAVAAPYDEEKHRSIYFSLFGRDLERGESAETRARLWLGRDLPNEQIMGLYDTFQEETKSSP
jgi:hypothetical protein